MNDTAPAAATQTVVVAPTPAPRLSLREWLPVIISAITTGCMIGGFLLAIGDWRATVNMTLLDYGRRIVKAESNQERYIPVVLGMQGDLRYLAERARREDEREDRRAR